MADAVTTVLLIRHAERGMQPPGDPPLNAAGKKRAQALIQVAGDAGIAAIYVSEFVRSQQTAQPLATHLGLVAVTMPGANNTALVTDLLAKHRGKVVLIVGHTNTIPDIIAQLCNVAIAPIDETEFDNLYVATRTGPNRGQVLHLHYGEPT